MESLTEVLICSFEPFVSSRTSDQVRDQRTRPQEVTRGWIAENWADQPHPDRILPKTRLRARPRSHFPETSRRTHPSSQYAADLDDEHCRTHGRASDTPPPQDRE